MERNSEREGEIKRGRESERESMKKKENEGDEEENEEASFLPGLRDHDRVADLIVAHRSIDGSAISENFIL